MWLGIKMAAVLRRKFPIVVVGSTGTGKSKLALEIAAKYQGEIISTDSMQVCGLTSFKNSLIYKLRVSLNMRVTVKLGLALPLDVYDCNTGHSNRPASNSIQLSDWLSNLLNK